MEKVKLYENERVDSLLAENLQIIQSADVFSFSLDAVLLADFVKSVSRPDRKAVDLCLETAQLDYLSVKNLLVGSTRLKFNLDWRI